MSTRRKRLASLTKRFALVVALLFCCSGLSSAQIRSPDLDRIASGAGDLPWLSGAGTHSWQEFSAWRARQIDVWNTWNNADTWSAMNHLYTLASIDKPPRFRGRLSFAQPLIATGQSYTDCADGDNDSNYAAIARSLVAAGWGGAYLRLSYEMNGSWFPWSVPAGQEASFRECFQRAARVFKSVSRYFVVEWNPSAGAGPLNTAELYPGDGFVDVIAVDSYDSGPSALNLALWSQQCGTGSASDPRRLCDFAAFARAHHKKLSVPEWGIDRDEGGDNPFYIQQMYKFFTANRDVLAYESYFDLMGANFELSHGQNPRAADEYKKLFGQEGS